jgi:hypothetical protein
MATYSKPNHALYCVSAGKMKTRSIYLWLRACFHLSKCELAPYGLITLRLSLNLGHHLVVDHSSITTQLKTSVH